MIPASLAPWALVAVIVVALVVIIVMVVLLRRSSKASQFADAQEPEEEEQESAAEEPPPAMSIGSAFRRAKKLIRRASDGDPYEIPFILLAGAEGSRPVDLMGSTGMDMPFGDPGEAETSLAMGRGFW